MTPMQQFLPPVTNVAMSAFSRVAEDRIRFQKAALQLLGWVAFVSGLLVALVLGTADWIVAIILGRQWDAAVPIFMALAFLALVQPSASVLETLLVARGRLLTRS